MEINQIRYFLEVCNCGSISKAADKLHMSQQGLSMAIRRLESELGCDLFYRKTGGLVVTDIGLRFRGEAEEVMRHINRIYDYCASYGAGKTRICVAITNSVIVRLPPKLQQLLINGTKEFDVKLIEHYSSNCADMVCDGEAVFGIIYGEADVAKLDVTTLDMVKQVIIVNRENPLAEKDEIDLAELDNVPIACPDEYSTPRIELARKFERRGLHLNVAYVCNRPRQVIDVVSNNPWRAARTLADELTEHDLERVKVLELKNDSFLIPIRLISKKGRTLTVQERLFKHLIIDSYRNDE